MGEIRIRLDGSQAHIVRGAVARDAKHIAKAIVADLESVSDGHFTREKADYSRDAIEYCVGQLHDALAVLRQLPWSSEEEADRGLAENEAEIRAVIERSTKVS